MERGFFSLVQLFCQERILFVVLRQSILINEVWALALRQNIIVKCGMGVGKWGASDKIVVILSYYIGDLKGAILTHNFLDCR